HVFRREFYTKQKSPLCPTPFRRKRQKLEKAFQKSGDGAATGGVMERLEGMSDDK
ncbi:hypothetical protein CEXT_140011, partial [Caerostris extrusa]